MQDKRRMPKGALRLRFIRMEEVMGAKLDYEPLHMSLSPKTHDPCDFVTKVKITRAKVKKI